MCICICICIFDCIYVCRHVHGHACACVPKSRAPGRLCAASFLLQLAAATADPLVGVEGVVRACGVEAMGDKSVLRQALSQLRVAPPHSKEELENTHPAVPHTAVASAAVASAHHTWRDFNPDTAEENGDELESVADIIGRWVVIPTYGLIMAWMLANGGQNVFDRDVSCPVH